jgi:hypothetical protein
MGLVLLECSVRILARISTSIADVLFWFSLAISVKSQESSLNYAMIVSFYVIRYHSYIRLQEIRQGSNKKRYFSQHSDKLAVQSISVLSKWLAPEEHLNLG